MNHIILVIALLQLVAARPQNSHTTVIAYENVNDGEGYFKLAFKTDNGIEQQQTGRLEVINSTTNATVLEGSYSVVTPDNTSNSSLLSGWRFDKDGNNASVVLTSEEQKATSSQAVSSPSRIALPPKEGINPPLVVITKPEEHKANATELPHQTNWTAYAMNLYNATQGSNRTAVEEFPDRIGTPAIITLTGPPG